MKERLDILLVEKGFFESREKAKGAIMAGVVFVNNFVSDKPGMSIDTEANIFIKEDICPYVSRGGLKLKKAVEAFELQLTSVVGMDIGASTGGFTDCMLKEGATKVYAIDVGYGQLDWKLRNDPKVVNMEKTNFRHLTKDKIPDEIDFVSIDVSFISVKLIFPVMIQFLRDGAEIICLVKPQFEAGREQVGKNGIIREKSVHIQVIENVMNYGLASGLATVGLTFSPVTGAKGNIEYLLYLKKSEQELSGLDVTTIVDAAHETLRK